VDAPTDDLVSVVAVMWARTNEQRRRELAQSIEYLVRQHALGLLEVVGWRAADTAGPNIDLPGDLSGSPAIRASKHPRMPSTCCGSASAPSAGEASFVRGRTEIRATWGIDIPVAMERDEREELGRIAILDIVRSACEQAPPLRSDWFAVGARR